MSLSFFCISVSTMRDWAEAMMRNASWGLKRRRKFTELGGVTGKVLTKKKVRKKARKEELPHFLFPLYSCNSPALLSSLCSLFLSLGVA